MSNIYETICYDLDTVSTDETSRERMIRLETQYFEILRRLTGIEETGKATLEQAKKTNGRVNNHSWQLKIIYAIFAAVGAFLWWLLQLVLTRYIGTIPKI